MTVVVLSGACGVGKTTLAEALPWSTAFSSRALIDRVNARSQSDRAALASAGRALDARTDGAWLALAVSDLIRDANAPISSNIIVDAVRTAQQIHHLRQTFGEKIVHVHLDASEEVLAQRFAQRGGEEQAARALDHDMAPLRRLANHVVDTTRMAPDEVLLVAMAHLGWAQPRQPLIDVVIGGCYGSEGKGHVASFIAPQYELLVRSGGPNAGHQVWETGGPYCFHHLPSGTKRAQGAYVALAPGASVWLPKLLEEIRDCQLTPRRLRIDPGVLVIEQSDRDYEQRLQQSIGSTAQGVGAAAARRILRGAGGAVRTVADIPELKHFLYPTARILDEVIDRGGRVMLEGTQGSGLSLLHGPYPHVTSRDTNSAALLSECGVAPAHVRRTILVCRSHPIRVQSPDRGTSGPMAKEIAWDEVAASSGRPVEDVKRAEITSTTKRQRRVEHFDWNLFKRSVTLNAPTDIALTFADYISPDNASARKVEDLEPGTRQFISSLEAVARAPVSMVSVGFGWSTVIDRRSWR